MDQFKIQHKNCLQESVVHAQLCPAQIYEYD